MQVRVQVQGIRRLRRELRRDPERAKRVLRSATKAGAVYLRPRILRNIKRSKKKKSFHLGDSAQIRSGRRTTASAQSTDILFRKGKKVNYGFCA